MTAGSGVLTVSGKAYGFFIRPESQSQLIRRMASIRIWNEQTQLCNYICDTTDGSSNSIRNSYYKQIWLWHLSISVPALTALQQMLRRIRHR